MRSKLAAFAVALLGAVSLLAVPADAAPKKKRVYTSAQGGTVYVSRDEDGRTRTRVIVQKRSYLNPGTERFPGERSDYDYAQLPNQRASSVLDNTVFGGSSSALPDQWTLPSKRNPFLSF